MYDPRITEAMRRLALRNYCIANGNYDAFVSEMATKKVGNDIEYVNYERAQKFIYSMVPLFSPYIWDWDKADTAVPTVHEFKYKLNLNRQESA